MLAGSLKLVNALLASPRAALAFSADADPLQINLPPLGAGSGAGYSAEGLRVMASLYFQAELEQAAVIPLAELLTESRYSLQLTDRSAAELLENFADGQQRRWPNRQSREQLFARTFGIGAGVTADSGAMINRDFETVFARFCYALVQYDNRARYGQPGATAAVQVQFAARQLLANLRGRQFGNTLVAAQRIQAQLQAAIDLLNHPGLTRLFQARNLWDLIRNVLAEDAPPLSQIVTRGQSGLRLITWMADNLAPIRDGDISSVLAASGSQPVLWAANWLQATGLSLSESAPAPQQPWPTGPSTPPAYGGGMPFSATALLREAYRRSEAEEAA